jgi:protein JSN1
VKTPTIGGPEDNDDEESANLTEKLSNVVGAAAVSSEQQTSAEGGGVENYRSQLVIDLVKAGVQDQVLQKGLGHNGEVTDQQMIMQVLSTDRQEDGDVKAAAGEWKQRGIRKMLTGPDVAEPRVPGSYFSSIPLIAERPGRRFDSARLKELRKKLDSGFCELEEIDMITAELMDDCAEVRSCPVYSCVSFR